MQIIPILDTYAQTMKVQLAGQSARIDLRQKSTGFYCDLYVNDALIIGGVICENLNLIVRSVYLGFVGDLMFQDTAGADDPSSPGLGTRFVLCYLSPEEVAG